MFFKPMLSAKADISKLTYPLGASPKLDGIRALIYEGVVYSRTLKPIRNQYVQAVFGKAEYNGLDGELIVGSPTDPDCYRNTNSGVMSADGEPDVYFYVFDLFTGGKSLSFIKRFKFIQDYILGEPAGTRLKIVPHNLIENQEVLEVYEKAVVEMGYEGIMLRDPNAPYKFGRSTQKEGILMKLKRFSDSEAEIIGSFELMHNSNPGIRRSDGVIERSSAKEGMVPTGVLGGFKVRDLKTGVEFEVGTGFSAEERKLYWQSGPLEGQVIKYKYFAYGEKDKPRHPVFLGFRDEVDIV